MKALATASILVALFVSASAQTWDPDMQMKVKAVGSPRVSPDGSRLVYTVNEAVTTPDKSEFVTQIWMANVATKQSAQLTFGEKSSTNPKWSPDGKWIAFTSNRKDNKNNLYRLSLDGGEAEPLTDLKSNVQNFAWSPDGRYIAYTMADPKTEEEEKKEKDKDDAKVVDKDDKHARLWIVDVASGETRALTKPNWNLDELAWLPAGDRVVVKGTDHPESDEYTERILPFR